MYAGTQQGAVVYVLVVEAIGADLVRVRAGMERIARVADVASVPVAWALDARGARSAAGWLNERRDARRAERPDRRDEDVLVMLNVQAWVRDESGAEDAREAAERLVRLRDALRRRVEAERQRVQEALPWTRPVIAGADCKNEGLVWALEGTGFEALWGYRWNEGSRRAQDRGCPFGWFPVGRERFQSAGAPMSELIGIPRESGDFSFWRRIPPEPLDGAGAASMPCGQRELAAFGDVCRRLADNASKNAWTAANHALVAEACADWSDEDAAALSSLWQYIRERGFATPSLGDAVALYRQRFPETEPTALLWRDALTGGETHPTKGNMLLYYDARAQYIFDEGRAQPSEMYNYATPASSSRYLQEYDPPAMLSFAPLREREQLRLDFSLDAPKPMPYALFLWGDHSHLRLADTNVQEVCWLGTDGVLVLLDLETGANDFYVVLTIE
jgi:hypothetical protein